MRIALVGNPNSGKTTMFNVLTGRNEKVGNWSGVTVDKKEYPVKKSYYLTYHVKDPLIATDLPGAYSMSPFTSEESITREYIKSESPDVIVNVVDSVNLGRSLFFTTQLLELGIPVVIVLNKNDASLKKGILIDAGLLSKRLGCPVIKITARNATGFDEVINAVFCVEGRRQKAPYIERGVNPADKKAVDMADRRRYLFVDGIVKAVEKRQAVSNKKNVHDKIDAILINRWLGIPVFALVMSLVFRISQEWLGAWIADGITLRAGEADEVFIPGLVTFIDRFGECTEKLLANADPLLRSVIVDGIIGGVGAVVGFLPLVMVMYFLIALLEDCGYIARATVVLDPVFKKVGLSGKSVIPFIMGTGCAIPGIMACRTIRDERERRATAMLTPFMPCGAKLPIISLFAGAFFGGIAWVGTLMYFAGILIILLSAFIINRITGTGKKKNYFIIELPEYKVPGLFKATASMCRRGREYIVKAGTIILICNFSVKLMQTFGWNLRPVDNTEDSILASVATPVAYLIAPVIGVTIWQFAAATITGFIAKENVVGTLAVCFADFLKYVRPDDLTLAGNTKNTVASLPAISKAAALAYLVFNLFSPPCFAAIGAMNAELKSRKWLFAGIGLQLGIGYSLGFSVFFFGSVLTGGDIGPLWMPVLGWSVVFVFVMILVLLMIGNNHRFNTRYIYGVGPKK